MGSTVDVVRRRLLENGMQYLVVFEGNCTGAPMIWVHGLQYRPLGSEELDVLDRILGDPKPREKILFAYGVWEAKVAMALGIREQEPMCMLCGGLFDSGADVSRCEHSEAEAIRKSLNKNNLTGLSVSGSEDPRHPGVYFIDPSDDRDFTEEELAGLKQIFGSVKYEYCDESFAILAEDVRRMFVLPK